MEDTKKAKTQEQHGLTPIAESLGVSQSTKQFTFSQFKAFKKERALEEKKQCDQCKGYPCRKAENPCLVPAIQHGEVTWGHCEPYKAYLRQEALGRKFQYAKIPPRYEEKTYADYKVDSLNKPAVDFAKTFPGNNYRGAFFYGGVGTGKTFLAALIAQDFIRAGKTVLFEKVADLLTEFYSVYRGEGKNEDTLLKNLYEVDLLVLDDFGLEKATQFVGVTLCKILDSRYNRDNALTIITSNYSLEQIKARLNKPSDLLKGDFCLNGSRIYDRCIEICKPILFKGDSRRR